MAYDRINDVLAFTTHNIAVTATGNNISAAIDVSGFENGIAIAWNLVAITGESISDISVLEGDTSGGTFVSIPTDRLIFPELFVKEFGTQHILQLEAPTGTDVLVSHFGVRDAKQFIKIGISTTVTMAGTTNIICNLFLHTESSPVRKNQVGFTFSEPQ